MTHSKIWLSLPPEYNLYRKCERCEFSSYMFKPKVSISSWRDDFLLALGTKSRLTTVEYSSPKSVYYIILLFSILHVVDVWFLFRYSWLFQRQSADLRVSTILTAIDSIVGCDNRVRQAAPSRRGSVSNLCVPHISHQTLWGSTELQHAEQFTTTTTDIMGLLLY